MKKPSYGEKLKTVRQFTTLGIKSKKNFTPQEKRLITRYYNNLRKTGYIEYDPEIGVYTQKVKFIKSKKPKEKIKGMPKISGYFVPGAKPGDIVRGNKIVRDNLTKEFFALNFSKAPVSGDFKKLVEYCHDKILKALGPVFKTVKENDYFTIILLNGFEIGQVNRSKNKNKKEGRAYGGKDTAPARKVKILAEKIAELLIRADDRYAPGLDTITGIYLWKFKNQRAPTKKEKKIVKKGRK